MKKILFILAIIATYGVSIANTSAKVNPVNSDKVTIVADDNSNITAPEGEKDKKKTEKKKTEAKVKETKKATGCTEAQKKSCAASGKTCGAEKSETSAKKGCCGGEKK
ncbi:MAG: hypothetical protein ACK5M7_14825 [Draconibacterium sp.]